MNDAEKEINALRLSDKYEGILPYASVEAFLSVGSPYKSADENNRARELRRLFLELLKTPQFHLMNATEKGELIGIETATVQKWMKQVPDEYLAEALKEMREKSARASIDVDAALYRESVRDEGDAKHKELFYRRIEGWVPKQDMELTRGRDKELDSRANFDLLKELVKGLSPEEKRQLLGNAPMEAIETKVERMEGPGDGGTRENGQQSGS